MINPPVLLYGSCIASKGAAGGGRGAAASFFVVSPWFIRFDAKGENPGVFDFERNSNW
jgi:hypothetical protein